MCKPGLRIEISHYFAVNNRRNKKKMPRSDSNQISNFKFLAVLFHTCIPRLVDRLVNQLQATK